MKRIARGILIACLALASMPTLARDYGPGTPPIWPNTIASTSWDLIRATDPDALTGVTFVGLQDNIEMPPSVSNPNVSREQAYVFRAAFRDSKSIDLRMSKDYGSEAAARADVDKYAPRLGKLPKLYRDNIRYMVGHVGDSNLSSEDAGHFFVIFKARAEKRQTNNDLEESFFHEGTHAAIQRKSDDGVGVGLLYSAPEVLNPDWLAAVSADNAFVTTYAATSQQEDFAEHALVAYAMIFHPDRFPKADRAAIQKQIPNRIEFFRRKVFVVVAQPPPPPPPPPRLRSDRDRPQR